MIDKIIVAIVAALVVVVAPTPPAAEVWDKPYDRQSYIAFVAMLLTYNQHCTSLPDHTKNQVDGMAATLDRSDQSELAVAIMNAGVDLHQTGTLKWCEAKKPLINEFVKARQQGPSNHDSRLRDVAPQWRGQNFYIGGSAEPRRCIVDDA